MLPTGKKDKGTAVQILMYVIWTMIVSLVPAFGITGNLHLSITGAVFIFLIGLVFLYFAVRLYHKRDDVSAKWLILASVAYISLLQLIYVLDKWLI